MYTIIFCLEVSSLSVPVFIERNQNCVLGYVSTVSFQKEFVMRIVSSFHLLLSGIWYLYSPHKKFFGEAGRADQFGWPFFLRSLF